MFTAIPLHLQTIKNNPSLPVQSPLFANPTKEDFCLLRDKLNHSNEVIEGGVKRLEIKIIVI